MVKKITTAFMSMMLIGLIVSPTVLATYNPPESQVDEIRVYTTGNPGEVRWEVDGTLQSGVKVVWSQNPSPEYPNRSGDKYQYITDSSIDRAVLTPFSGDGQYYVRVCEYLGGSCGTYSMENNGQGVTINLNSTKDEYFKDVDKSTDLYVYLEEAAEKGIYKEREYFNPENAITRGQFAAVIVRAFQIPYDTSGEQFPDVPETHTFYKEIMTLRNLGVLQGDNGKFLPEASVTRGQAFKIVMNTLEKLGLYYFSDSNLDLETKFQDPYLNSHTFSTHMKKVLQATEGSDKPIFSGYSDGYLRPDNSITRIQSTKVIVNTMYLGEKGETPSGEVNSITVSGIGSEINWVVDGYSENGFKVVWSKNAGPEYPTREGDKYHYLSSPSADSDVLTAFSGTGTYHVRVCEYLGGTCGVYSNEITVELEEGSGNVESITLSGTTADISWETSGYSENGFKVVWSKNAGPEYPTREGDKYHYLSSPSADSDTLTAFSGAGTYYVRVCEYLGGACGVYSNEIEVEL
ncbi:hypothetical protein GF362_03545 [Candidatus Dojkabacteria bacterium]|nr:hypothetical protein [Candidatus Dojkabacteria bacterium]